MRLPNGYGGVVKLSGNRRRPYAARITTGWHINDITGKRIQHYQILGYAPTRSEALQILARYNNYPIDGETLKLTFREIYLRWSEEKFPTISHSNIKGYRAAYATCENIADMPFHNLRLNDLQQVIDHCGKNYPTLKKIRVLFNQLYSYAMKHEIVSKDYSAYVNISKYKDRNPNKNIRSCFSTSEIALLWKHKNDPYCQTVLMLIYNGVRVSELLDLKKENVHLSEQYFDVIDSKTENGIRKVPIADKVLPFYQRWLHDCSDCEYLIHTLDSQHFTYLYVLPQCFPASDVSSAHRSYTSLLPAHHDFPARRSTCRSDDHQKNCRSFRRYVPDRTDLHASGCTCAGRSHKSDLIASCMLLACYL